MKFYGCRFDPYDNRDYKFKIATTIQLPNMVNNLEFITPIKDQGHCGSCVAFAVTKAVEMLYWQKTLKRNNLSERWAYEKAKTLDEWPGENYEGTSVRAGLKAAYKLGIPPERFWKYNPNRKGKPKPKAAKAAENFKIKKYERIKGILPTKIAIFQRGFVVASAMVHEGWYKAKRHIPYKPKYGFLGGHAFLIVGYNKHGFIVVNSWGKKWGKKGHSILKYNDAHLHLIDAWTADI